MNKKEIKKLLKARNKLIEAKEFFVDGAPDIALDFDMYNIYQQGLNNIENTLMLIDEDLMIWCQQSPIGRWLLQINGITVDLAAGLMSYFDVTNKECAAQFIRFAGVDDYTKPYNDNVGKIMSDVKNSFRKQENSVYKNLAIVKFTELIGDAVELHTAHNRANRYMLKIFLGHLFEEMYREEHNGELPIRYNDSNKVIIEPEVSYTK